MAMAMYIIPFLYCVTWWYAIAFGAPAQHQYISILSIHYYLAIHSNVITDDDDDDEQRKQATHNLISLEIIKDE